MVGPLHYLVLAALLFGLGAVGVVLRRNALIVLMSIELMLNAVNLTFLTFSRFPLVQSAPTQGGFLTGHAAVFFVIAVFRSRTSVNVDEFDTLKF
ncbi:MAG TPA: NADH-quinone oxidoreductase subunit NuoK [Myxococcales bacterium]|nr:NADH-quinone oxidoreductase subunit NuoK [Myxococcales bacterium]